MVQTSVLGSKAFVDFEDGDRNDEADEEELPLLLQPHQLHSRLTVGAAVRHHEVVATVIQRLLTQVPCNTHGGALAPEGLLELVQQCQRHEAAVLTKAKYHQESGMGSVLAPAPFLTRTSMNRNACEWWRLRL